jgi:hypothetical protein
MPLPDDWHPILTTTKGHKHKSHDHAPGKFSVEHAIHERYVYRAFARPVSIGFRAGFSKGNTGGARWVPDHEIMNSPDATREGELILLNPIDRIPLESRCNQLHDHPDSHPTRRLPLGA